MTLQFFTFFPVIYSTYTGSARKKSSRIFSCACVRIRLNEFSPGNICLYTIAAAMRGSGQAWRLESAMGISCLWWTQTWLKSAQVVRHCYDVICAHNLFAVSYRQVANWQVHIILQWKNVWMHTNLPWKNVMMWVNIHMKKCEWWWLWY